MVQEPLSCVNCASLFVYVLLYCSHPLTVLTARFHTRQDGKKAVQEPF